MHPSNSVTALLAILLIVLNGKAIVEYVLWLRFKIRTTFKQMENKQEITIIPHEDHQQYSVNGHTVYKDSNENYISRTEMSGAENTAFRRYKQLVIDNPAFKKHTKATYKI